MTFTTAKSEVDWRELWPEGAGGTEWSHSGIAVVESGRDARPGGGTLAFAEPGGGGLVLFRIADGSVERVPVPLLEIHGIFFDERGARGARSGESRDAGGDDAQDHGPTGSLWLADPGFKARPDLGYEVESRPGQAGRFDLGTARFEPLALPGHPAYASRSWEPTSVVAFHRGSDGAELAFVADGYGASLVHLYVDGRYGRTIDGSGSGVVFACPHGVVVDTRGDIPVLVVADRGNKRLVVYSLDGTFIRVISGPLMTTPSSLALRGDDLLVTELDGALLAVDRDDEIRGIVVTRDGHARPGWPNAIVGGETEPGGRLESPELRRPDLEPDSLNSPHGLAVARDGRVYLTEWLIGGRLWELTLRS